MSSRTVCVDVILQFEHSSPLVMLLLLGVVVGEGMCGYCVVVVLSNGGFVIHQYVASDMSLNSPQRMVGCNCHAATVVLQPRVRSVCSLIVKERMCKFGLPWSPRE